MIYNYYIFRRRYFIPTTYFCFDFSPLTLLSFSGSRLRQLLLWYINGDFLFLSLFIDQNFLCERVVASPPFIYLVHYLCQYGLVYLCHFLGYNIILSGLPRWLNGKGSTCQCRKNSRDSGSILGQEDPLDKGMATHSSILAWNISWTEDPSGLQSMGLPRIGCD